MFDSEKVKNWKLMQKYWIFSSSKYWSTQKPDEKTTKEEEQILAELSHLFIAIHKQNVSYQNTNQLL